MGYNSGVLACAWRGDGTWRIRIGVPEPHVAIFPAVALPVRKKAPALVGTDLARPHERIGMIADVG